jgi:large subunit ribosomal protein L6
MSRIGKQPVPVPKGVTASVSASRVQVKGSLGELSMELPRGIGAEVQDGRVVLTRPDDSRQSKSFHGLARNLVANMVEGVSKGFSRALEIQGVGFKAAVQGQKLVLSLGFSSPQEFLVPDGVKVVVTDGTAMVVSGADKQKVGDTAARIRSFYPAEPYKGKGVRYKGEHVRRKVGKTVA